MPRRAAMAAIVLALTSIPAPRVAGAPPAVPASATPPLRWNAATGENVRWVTELGSYSYGGPVVAGGKVFVGTNNARPRDPAITDDRGVLMAFRAADGAFLWQATHPKLEQALDFPLQGVCSTPAVVGDRLYYVS